MSAKRTCSGDFWYYANHSKEEISIVSTNVIDQVQSDGSRTNTDEKSSIFDMISHLESSYTTPDAFNNNMINDKQPHFKSFSINEQQPKHNYNMNDLDEYINIIKNDWNLIKILTAVKTLKDMMIFSSLNDNQIIIQKILKSGCIHSIIQFMSSSINNELKYNSAWIVTDVAGDEYNGASEIIKYGAIQGFAHLIRNEYKEQSIVDTALTGLSNITAANTDLCNKVVKTRILNDIINNIYSWSLQTQRKAIWVIFNICRNSSNLDWLTAKQIILLIIKLMKHIKDEDIVQDFIWILVYLSNPAELRVYDLFIQGGVVIYVMEIIKSQKVKYDIMMENVLVSHLTPAKLKTKATKEIDMEIAYPCIRVIGNILSGNIQHTQAILDTGFCDIIEPFLNHYLVSIKRETLWMISNILATNYRHSQIVLSKPKIVKCIFNSAKNSYQPIRKEAAWCICNAIDVATLKQIAFLVKVGCIETLAGLLKIKSIYKSQETLILILNGIDRILNSSKRYPNTFIECNGLNYLTDLQTNEKISNASKEKIYKLIGKYFKRKKENKKTFFYCLSLLFENH